MNPFPDPSATLYFNEMEIELDSFKPPTTRCKDRHDTSSGLFGKDVFCMRVATLSSKEYSLITCCHPIKNMFRRIGILSDYVGYPGGRRQGRLPWTNQAKCLTRFIALE
jgi:hypothetical protein